MVKLPRKVFKRLKRKRRLRLTALAKGRAAVGKSRTPRRKVKVSAPAKKRKRRRRKAPRPRPCHRRDLRRDRPSRAGRSRSARSTIGARSACSCRPRSPTHA